MFIKIKDNNDNNILINTNMIEIIIDNDYKTGKIIHLGSGLIVRINYDVYKKIIEKI